MLESIVTHNRPFRKFDTLGIPHVQSHIDVLLGAVEKVQSGLDSSSTVFEGDNNELLDYFLNGGEFNPFPLRLDVPSDYSNNPNLAELASDSLKIKSTVDTFLQEDWLAVTTIDTASYSRAVQEYVDVVTSLSGFDYWIELNEVDNIRTAQVKGSVITRGNIKEPLKYVKSAELNSGLFDYFMSEASGKLGFFQRFSVKEKTLQIRKVKDAVVVEASYYDKDRDFFDSTNYTTEKTPFGMRVTNPDTVLNGLISSYAHSVETEHQSLLNQLGPVAGAYVVSNMLQNGASVINQRLARVKSKKADLADEYSQKQHELDRQSISELGDRLLLAKINKHYKLSH